MRASGSRYEGMEGNSREKAHSSKEIVEGVATRRTSLHKGYFEERGGEGQQNNSGISREEGSERKETTQEKESHHNRGGE